MALNIQNSGVVLPDKYTQLAIKHGIEYKVPPSLFICQWWYESNFGISPVAKDNNNWGGSTYPSKKQDSLKRPSGVTVYRGTARPSVEKGHYMKFKTVDDYMIDYFYLLLKQGIYNVAGHNDWNKAVAGLFKQGGAKYDYAGAGYNRYNEMMRGIRAGINKRNNNILDKIDKDPASYLDGDAPTPQPTDPVDPPPSNPETNPPPDTAGSFEGYIDKMYSKLNDFLTVDLYHFDNGITTGNRYVKILKQGDNMYKIKPTLSFNNTFKDIISNGLADMGEIITGLVRPDKPEEPGPDPDPKPEKPDPEAPDPDPNIKKYFPVRYSNSGINFWKTSNWKPGTTQYQMGYGWTRNNGKRFHSGYDIGAGGKTGNGIYSVSDGKVIFARWSDSGGFMMQIKQSDYYVTYMHLQNKSNTVKVGDTVKAGQRIATMGNTPGNVAIHLHIVLSKNGETNGEGVTVNPEPYLGVTGDNKTNLPKP